MPRVPVPQRCVRRKSSSRRHRRNARRPSPGRWKWLRQRLRAQSVIIRSLEVSDENNALSLSIVQQEAALAQRKADSTRGQDLVFEEADYERIRPTW